MTESAKRNVMENKSSAKLNEYVSAILQADTRRSESICGKIADKFEDDLLHYEEFPPDYFGFFLKLISERDFFSKPGIWNFFLVLSTEKKKLTKEHYAEIGDCILAHYSEYGNEDLCLAVCDFVARNFDEESARNLLTAVKAIEGSKPSFLMGFADDGLRILSLEIARNSKS